jgi:hypothetical protein
MHGAIPPLPHLLSWRIAELSIVTDLPLPMISHFISFISFINLLVESKIYDSKLQYAEYSA